jgi:hypothetical protein
MFDVIVRHEVERSVATLVVADPDPLAWAAKSLRSLSRWMRRAKSARRSPGRRSKIIGMASLVRGGLAAGVEALVGMG